ncbi:MAG: general secretion pathway protein GspE [Deltaproteobacteria bacterium]|nr:general secretion pathway protein GspE [Deltaproteobacteria bacterium]
MTRKRRLGEILLAAGLVTESQLTAALHSQKTWGGKLGSTLVRMGFVREEDLLACLSTQLRLPSVNLGAVKIAPRAIQALPHRIAEKYNVIPVALKEELGKKTIILAMSDPTNLDAISEIQFQTGVSIRPVVAAESSITRAIDEYYLRKGPKLQYGYEKTVDLAKIAAADEMVLVDRGDEKTLSPLDGLDASKVLRLLIRVLEEKGVISARDLEEALKRSS